MYAVLVVSLATFCGSKAVQAADCSKSNAVQTLDLKRLEGNWYEHSSYGTPFGHRLERCHMTSITAGSDGKSFVMANDRVVRLINTHIKTNWIVEGKGDKLTGDLTLKFKLPLIGVVAVPFKILGTDDYKNYIIFQACYSFASVFKSNLGFIFTRKRHYEAKELQSLYSSIEETLKNNGLSRSKFTLSNQRNCEVKSISSDNTDSDASNKNTSADESQTTESSASTNSAVEAEETSETQAASESAANAEHSDQATSPNTEKTGTSGTQESVATETKITEAPDMEEPVAAKTEETAASKTEETADSKTMDIAASKTEDSSASKTDDTSASKTEEPAASKSEEPSSSSKTEETATSKSEETSAIKTEETADSKTEQVAASETANTVASKTEETASSQTEE